MLVPHLHRQRNSLQCAHLLASLGFACVVLLPDPLYPASEAARPCSSIWAVQNGFHRHSSQHVRAVLPHIRRALDAFPTSLACHEGQHELLGADLRCRCAGRLRALVHPWSEDFSDASEEI